MTYPPQRPGPGGWEQRPADNGFRPPPGEQPNWYGNQHAGTPRQGPGQPIRGQPHQGQQPQSGPPGQPPRPPQWGTWIPETNGFADVEPEKPKSRTPLLLGGIGAVLVVLIGGGGLLWWLSGDDPGAARPIAQEVVAKVNAGDFNGVRSLFCEANREQLNQAMDQLQQYTFDLRLGNVTESGDRASARLTGSYEASGAAQPVGQTMGLMEGKGAGLEQLKQMGATDADVKQLMDSVTFDVRPESVGRDGDDRATATIAGTIGVSGTFQGVDLGSAPATPIDQSLNMVVEDGDWKLC